MRIYTGNSDSFFLAGNYAPFELRNLAIKYTIETDCQRNSSETAQQIIVKLCSDEEHTV